MGSSSTLIYTAELILCFTNLGSLVVLEYLINTSKDKHVHVNSGNYIIFIIFLKTALYPGILPVYHALIIPTGNDKCDFTCTGM